MRDSLPSASEVFAALPEPGPDDPALRESIRAMRSEDGVLLGVLDDDPTGSQAVHGVQVVTVAEESAYHAAFDGPAATCFVLTNTRSLDQPAAVEANKVTGRGLISVAETRRARVQLVSRSDSTLRGHVMAEVAALDHVRREAYGRGFDGVLLVPAFLEAGRITADDVHWARLGSALVPVGETEFARDATFGYRASDLRDFVAEKSGGAIAPEDVRSISLADIRLGGPDRVRDLLAGVHDGAWVVVNATEYSDLDRVAYGVLLAERAGQSFLFRTGPSFVRALSGLGPRPPLRGADLWPDGPPAGRPGQPGRPGHAGGPGHAGDPGHAGGPGQAGGPGHAGDPGHAGGPGHAGDPGHAAGPGQAGRPGHTGRPGPGGRRDGRGGRGLSDPPEPGEVPGPGDGPSRHGLIVVGSHMGHTSRQMAVLRARGDTTDIELDVPAIIHGSGDVAAATAHQVAAALNHSDVLLYTSRALVAGRDGTGDLAIARRVSAALARTVRGALTAKPAWIIAKGGITSHDVARHGLGIRRAEVAGQLFPGVISVFRPLDAAPEAIGLPYVVFAGNVGDEDTLRQAVAILHGEENP